MENLLLKDLLFEANSGDSQAQHDLGWIYYFGSIIVPKDPQKAFKWFKLSAEQGHAESQNKLGRIYYFGYGVKKDLIEAMKWFKLSADQGHEDALYYCNKLLHIARKSGSNQFLIKILKALNSDEYKLEIKYLEKCHK